MTVRAKTFSIIVAALSGVIAVLYVILSVTLMGGLARIERNAVQQNVTRVLRALDGELAALNETNGDWAPWDDTCAFVAGRAPDFADRNLTDSTFPNLRLNLMLFYNTSGRLVAGKGFDLRAKCQAPVPKSLLHLAADNPLLRHSGTTDSKRGLLLVPEGCLEISSRPILTTDFEGPIRGTLIMGRFLDPVELARLRRVTGLRVWTYRLDEPSLRSGRSEVAGELPAGEGVSVRPMGPDYVEGRAVMPDILGKPALLLCVGMPRDIHRQGRKSVQGVLLALLTVGAVATGVSLSLANRLVISRLARISAGVVAIGKSGDLSARVPADGNDELSALAHELNRTLDALQASHSQLEERERAFRRLFEEAAEQRERLRALAGRLADAEETERHRLSRELHDRVGQGLTALGINLNLIRAQATGGDSDAVCRRVEDSLALVDEATERIRDVMADLRPSVLDDYGLVSALRWYAAKLSERTGLVVVVEDPDAPPRLPAPVETNLFRIAQEALTNVVRHAQAQRVTITLEQEECSMRLTIADDGSGYQPKKDAQGTERGGWGLLIMAERAEAVGGWLRVVPGPSRGTCVEVEVPL